MPDEVRRAAVSGTTLSNETLPAWRNVQGRLSPGRFPLPPSPCQTNHMKRLTATICLTIALLLGSVGMSWSADFQKGWTAYESGDYATVFREWTPLAKQGNARAQYLLGSMCNEGLGVPQDYKAAAKWCRLAC